MSYISHDSSFRKRTYRKSVFGILGKELTEKVFLGFWEKNLQKIVF
jgi:hypothetical protein